MSAPLDAWHRLGIKTTSTSAQGALRAGDLLDWHLRKNPLYVYVGDDAYVDVPDQFGLIRDSPRDGIPDVLGVVGIGHTVVQNEEFIPFLDEFCRISGARFSRVGEIDDGRRIFVSMELPGRILIAGEEIKNYVVLLAGRDGQSSPALLVTPVHVSTGTVLNADPSARVPWMPGPDPEDVPVQAEGALNYVFDYLDDFRAEAEILQSLYMSDGRFDLIISETFGARPSAPAITQTRAQNKLDKMSALFTKRPDTAWDGYLALCEWFDHFSPIRGTDKGSSTYLRARKAILEPGFKETARKAVRM